MLRQFASSINLVPNPGFETDSNGDSIPDGWSFSASSGGAVLDSSTSHSGGRSLRLSNAVTADSGTFTTEVAVWPHTHYTFSAWFKSQGVLPTAAPAGVSPLRVRIEQLSAQGVVGTAVASGYSDTADWNKQFVGFQTLGNVRRVRVTGQIVAGSGTGWVDDVHLSGLLQAASIPVRGGVSAAADGSGKLLQHAELPGQQLTFDATYMSHKDHIRIDGSVTDTATANTLATDKAFQLTYTLPVNAAGWQWGDYARRSRTITSGTYSNNTIKLQQNSRYPFSAIYDSASSLAVGIPLDVPRIFRTRYSTSTGLSMTFDLGVSKAAAAMGARASFSIVIYTSDPSWGFRAATKKYYTMFPHYYVRRTVPAREGIWYVEPNLGPLSTSYKDFALGLHMLSLGMDSNQNNGTSGTQYVRWDNERAIYTSAYNHHWAFYFPRSDTTKLPTYEQAIASLQAHAASNPTTDAGRRMRDESQAALTSTPRDFNGRMYYEAYSRRSLAFYQNLDPDVSAAMDWARAVQVHQVQRAIDLASSVGGRLDGIHLDSTSGVRRWAAVDNYNRQHWRVANVPLTFSYDSGLVTQRGIFAMYEQVKRLAAFLQARGMILTVNFNANEATTGGFFIADQIDYFGIEQGLPERERSARYVSIDSFAMLKRSMAYQRPLSTLDSKMGDGSIPLSAVEDRIEQALFYGIYPGARGQEPGPYPRPDWTNENRRVIYAKYTPTLRKLAGAGWDPVTNARSSNPSVWVERFGRVSRNNLYLTLRNETEESQSYTLTVDLNKDGATAVQSARATEQITGASLPVTLNQAKTQATITATIAPKTTRAIRISVVLPTSPPATEGSR